MKSILMASVLLAGRAWAADEAADRTGIENAIRVFGISPPRAQYTSDFDDQELVRYVSIPPAGSGAIPITVDGAAGTVVISKEPMGEAQWFPAGQSTVISILKIRFLAPEIAMVDAVGKAPVLFVMKKVGADWKIASLRVLPEK